ncbi:MAG: hypothetical protein AAF551_11775 [Bacteroidota bacterium]
MRSLLTIGVLGVVIMAWVFIPSENFTSDKINGVSLVSPPSEVSSDKVGEVKRVNANWVAVIPYGFSRSGQSSVTYDHSRQWWGEKTTGAGMLINYAKDKGLKVMIKPHVWVMGEGWTGDFKLASESEWKQWEADYTAYLLNYAKVADSLGVDLLCVGTEYRTPAKERPEFWIGLIEKVRKVYKGPITYASNWDNYMNITWWDQVDYIGIDAYFPLAEGDSPSLEEIKKGWEPLHSDLHNLSLKWERPILFTEYGFQSADGAAGKHWEVNKSLEYANMEIQRKAYEATFESFWNDAWFAGGFLWKWHLTNRGVSRNKTRFTPQGKSAEKTIAKWYGKSN